MPETLTQRILSARGPRHQVDPWKPWHFLNEPEFSRYGLLEDVSTIFLTNRECPFHCLMCDLWKNTTTETVPSGAIPSQIEYALSRLTPSRHVKLYNSGNFFDARAIPVADWPAIARQVAHFDTVIVENHPRFCSSACGDFQQLCQTQLEVALGLETSHEPTLARLNKQMTVADFTAACRQLRHQQILIRCFILLKPPGTSESEGIERALQSLRLAFDCGASVCSVIPVRGGNGIMEQLAQQGDYQPPRLSSLETVLSEALSWGCGRVFGDLWDVQQFADGSDAAVQLERLTRLNREQCSKKGSGTNSAEHPLGYLAIGSCPLL